MAARPATTEEIQQATQENVVPIESQAISNVRRATSDEVRQVVNASVPPEKAATEEELDILRAVGEPAVTLGTGMVALPVSGLMGIFSGVSAAISGDDEALNDAVRRIEMVNDQLTFQPRTEEGSKTLGIVATPFEKLEELGKKSGTAGLGVTESPGIAAAAETAIVLSPMILGIGIRTAKAKKDIARINAGAKKLGIELGAKAGKKTEQIRGAAEEFTGERTTLGEPFPDVQAKVRIAKIEAAKNRDRLFEEATEAGGTVAVRSLEGLDTVIRESLRTFPIAEMPKVLSRLKELDKIMSLPGDAKLKLNAMFEFKQRINRSKPSFSSDPQQVLALDIIKGQVENHIDALFNSDMISGNPAAITKWREATKAHADYVKNFKADKVIKSLATQEATPETMRKWVFGASLTGAKKEAALTVKKLKEMIGEDSPEFVALRQDALLDMMEPLLRETPDFKGFVKQHDRLMRNNSSLAKELFPDSAESLKLLRDIANSAESLTPAQQQISIGRIGAVYVFGHGIARAAMKVKFAEVAFNSLRRIKNAGRRRQAMGDILGYDALAPLISPRAAGIPAFGEVAKRESQDIPLNQQ